MKAIDSEFAIARVVFHHQRLKGRQKSGKTLWWKKGKAPGALTGGCWHVAARRGAYYDLLGVHIWLSLIDPKLEREAKIRGAVNN